MGMSGSRRGLDSSAMYKRILAGVFWFMASAYFFTFANAMFGYPPTMGTLFSLGVALFMSVDPLGVLWKRQPTRRIARIPDPAVPADGKHAGMPGL
jgi:hypothetical protein